MENISVSTKEECNMRLWTRQEYKTNKEIACERELAHHDPNPRNALGPSDELPFVDDLIREESRYGSLWERRVLLNLLEELIDLCDKCINI